MSKASQIIVLAEDRRQQTFVKRHLERAGYRTDQIRPEPLPAGKGSGELWVRQRYAKNVAAYRTRASRAATALVIAIDADVEDVARRAAQLARTLEDAHMTERAPDEAIAHFIPKRNIETWILCLVGGNVDEESDYSEHDIHHQIEPAAVAFFEGSRALELPAHWVDSLRAAAPEARRLR